MVRNSFKYIFCVNLIIAFATLAAIFLGRKVILPPSYNEEMYISTALVSENAVSHDLAPSAKSAVIIDAKSGAVIFQKNSSARLPMASTTKIMTALAVLENAELSELITVTKEMIAVEGSKIYLAEGEKITVEELLYGLMLESGNDAAMALAIGVFGSVEDCCDEMNEIAHSMGLIDTHFENPHGLDSQNHYTTAYELSLIMQRAMKNDMFSKISATEKYVTAGQIKHYFSNHNKLLSRLDFCTGGKTGYTSKSGRCLVSSSKFDSEEYIAVTLSCSDDWAEHKNMHMFACESYDSVSIASKDEFFLEFGGKTYLPTSDIYLTVGEDDAKNMLLDYKITFCDGKTEVHYFCNDTPLGFFRMK